jgi:hypothetical protein
MNFVCLAGTFIDFGGLVIFWALAMLTTSIDAQAMAKRR